MLVFAAGLMVEGYTRGVLGENSSAEPSPGRHTAVAPAAVTSGGPVIRMAGSHPRSYAMPARTVALTFDDGPDPTWTPKILAVLRHYGVPGTFFLVGAHVASDPELVREELRDGDEIGSHTYTHVNLATAGWRQDFELTLTQNALAGTVGVRTRLLRMPYSSQPDALTAADWRAAEQAAGTATSWCWPTSTPQTGRGPGSRASWPPPCRTATPARSSCSTTAAATVRRRSPRSRPSSRGCAPAGTGSPP